MSMRVAFEYFCTRSKSVWYSFPTDCYFTPPPEYVQLQHIHQVTWFRIALATGKFSTFIKHKHVWAIEQIDIYELHWWPNSMQSTGDNVLNNSVYEFKVSVSIRTIKWNLVNMFSRLLNNCKLLSHQLSHYPSFN